MLRIVLLLKGAFRWHLEHVLPLTIQALFATLTNSVVRPCGYLSIADN